MQFGNEQFGGEAEGRGEAARAAGAEADEEGFLLGSISQIGFDHNAWKGGGGLTFFDTDYTHTDLDGRSSLDLQTCCGESFLQSHSIGGGIPGTGSDVFEDLDLDFASGKDESLVVAVAEVGIALELPVDGLGEEPVQAGWLKIDIGRICQEGLPCAQTGKLGQVGARIHLRRCLSAPHCDRKNQ